MRECRLGCVGGCPGGVDGIAGMSGVVGGSLLRSSSSAGDSDEATGHVGHAGAVGVPIMACDRGSVYCDCREAEASGRGVEDL